MKLRNDPLATTLLHAAIAVIYPILQNLDTSHIVFNNICHLKIPYFMSVSHLEITVIITTVC